MKKIVLLAIGLLLLGTNMACVVAESDYDQAIKERDNLAAELAEAREENRILNQSILEIYKERDNLLSRIDQLEARLGQSQKEPQETAAVPPQTVPTQTAPSTAVPAPTSDQTSGAATPNENGEPFYHTVVEGDTLSEIAAATGVPMAQIRELNNLQGDVVWLGQKLRIK